MRARDLVSSFPSASLETDALAAAVMLTEHQQAGLLVTNTAGEPYAVLPASRLIELMIPGYVMEDPNLARVIDERSTNEMRDRLSARSVGDCLPEGSQIPPVADAQDTILEVAALMVRKQSPLVVVVERAGRRGDPRLLGVVTAVELLQRLVGGQP